MAPPTEGGGDGLPVEEDTRMDDDKSEKKEVSQPAGTGLTEETKEGAFMVVGTVDKTRKLLGKLKERLKMPPFFFGKHNFRLRTPLTADDPD